MCAHSTKTYRVVAIFTFRPLYPWRKKLRYTLNSRLRGSHNRSWRSGKRKHSLSLLGIEPRFLGLKMRQGNLRYGHLRSLILSLITWSVSWLSLSTSHKFISNDDRWRAYSLSVRLETSAVTRRHLTGWLLVGAARNASLTQTVHSEYQATSKFKKVKRRSTRSVC